MTLRSVVIISTVLSLLFLYSVRSVLSPFILAAIIAYLLNPVVSFLQKRAHIPRGSGTIIIFLFLLGLLAAVAFWIGGTLVGEAREVTDSNGNLSVFSQNAIDQLPEFSFGEGKFGLKPIAQELPKTLTNTVSRWQNNLAPVVTGAIGRIVSFLVFLISTFYFLKDGNKIPGLLRSLLPSRYQEKATHFEKEVNQVLGDYLRGQIFLIAIMSAASWLILTTLGVKFALTLALFTGFLELIPYAGPIVATALVAFTSFLTVNNRWGLDPTSLATVIIAFYIFLRLVEDYFIIPQVLGHVTKLHPLLVLFAVFTGGHLAGPIGFILAVPIAATLRIIIIFLTKEVDWKK